MKNKAFTLVELLAVIVLLGVLSIVIIPKVGDTITNSKNEAYRVQEKNIKKAATDFIIENTSLLETTNTISIKLGTLKQKGYIQRNIKNPITRKNFSNESQIKIKKLQNQDNYEIELSLIDLEDVSEILDANSPIIVLKGDYIDYVEVFDTYEDPGALAYTAEGTKIQDISSQILLNGVESTLDTTIKGRTYQIKYSITYEGKTYFATRTVITRDTIAPILTIPEETTIHVSEVATFNPRRGASVTDNYDNNVSIQVDSNLTNTPGTYVITYTATDSSSNSTTERRIVKVIED